MKKSELLKLRSDIHEMGRRIDDIVSVLNQISLWCYDTKEKIDNSEEENAIQKQEAGKIPTGKQAVGSGKVRKALEKTVKEKRGYRSGSKGLA